MAELESTGTMALAIDDAIIDRKKNRNSHSATDANTEVAVRLKKTEKSIERDSQNPPYSTLTKIKAKSLSISSAEGGTPIILSPSPPTTKTILTIKIAIVASPARNLALITESR